MLSISLSILKMQRAFYNLFNSGDINLRNRMNIKVFAKAVNIKYGVNLYTPQHRHAAVQVKQNFVFWLSNSGMFRGDTDLHRNLVAAGLSRTGLSRRTVSNYVGTMGTQVKDSVSYLSFKPFMDSQS